MRPKSMILILIALGCGLIASIGISQVVERNGDGGAEAVQTSPIYVASIDINIKEELNAQRVKLEEWPVDRFPPGAVTTVEQMEEMAARQRIFAGEPILGAKLAPKNDLQTPSDRIKPGHRVMSIRVSMDTAVSHLLQPGDYVDILAFIRGSRGKGPKASTILSGIEVFALNDQTEMQDDGGSSIQAKTVSVQVTPRDASTLMFYAEQGRLRLTLRSRDDSGASGTVNNLAAEPAPPKPVKTAVVDLEESFRMEVLDGTGAVRKFSWKDNESLPTEVVENNGFSKGNSSEEKKEGIPPFGAGEFGEDGMDGNGDFGGLSGDALEGSSGSGSRNLNLGIEF